MKSLVDLKKELKDGQINHLYILVGEENLIRKIYYEKIAEIYGSIKSFDNVLDIYKELERKPLFRMKNVYFCYNDYDFLKQKEKVFERLISLSKKDVVVLVYDEIPDKGPFRKVFEDYITLFSYVTTDIAIKYIGKENNNINPKLARLFAYNAYNSYNSIKEEMNKYNYITSGNKDDAIDAMTYATLFYNRREIPTPKEFANAFITGDTNRLADYYKILKDNQYNILGYIPELYNTIVLCLYLKIYGKYDGGTIAYNAGEYWGRIKEIRDFRIIYNKNDLLDIRYLLDKMDKDIRIGRLKPEHSWEWLLGVIL